MDDNNSISKLKISDSLKIAKLEERLEGFRILFERDRELNEIALKLEEVIESMDEVLNQIKTGKGTIGKLVYDETLYNETESMVKDLKANPWKLLHKPRRKKTRTQDTPEEGNKGMF